MVTYVVHWKMTSLSHWYLRLITLVYGLMESKLISHAMLAHITAQKLQPFRFTTITSCAFVLTYFFTPLSSLLSEEALLWELVIYNTIGIILSLILAYFQFIIIVANELADALGIRVFLVKKISKD